MLSKVRVICLIKQSVAADNNIDQSVVYQNPGWPKVAGQGPIGVQ